MGALLALASALFYGLSDFAGGLLARRAPFGAVALAGQVGGLVLAAAAAPFLHAGDVAAADLGWGALSGVGTGVGMLFLFRGLGRGAMSVVVPTSAVAGVALPVLAGVAFLGERPSPLSWLGIVVAVPALWLVSRGTRTELGPAGPPTLDGLIAGVGIAVQYLALAQADPSAGVWPIVAGRVAAIITILPSAAKASLRLRGPVAMCAALTGVAAALALLCYLFATQYQLVVIAVVLSSLYPAIPVLLGITMLRERLSLAQAGGLAAAAAAIALLTTT
ncbi:EamA family transporter [Prauserella oleivorans]|uniref:EamA family transporter n=1 Tax=Prauserella oleivorans TaxID=1478153 RepID=A0ABW5WFV1_9PSEU